MIQSLARGLQILHLFATVAPELSLNQIAEHLAIPKGSAFRTVSTLEASGFIHQDSVSKRYTVGLKALGLSHACITGLRFPNVASPILEGLAESTQHSASMAVLDGPDIVYVSRASTRRVLSSNLTTGSHLPAFCTSMGRVLLASLDDDDIERALDASTLAPFTQYTITRRDALIRRIAEVRTRGYEVVDQELEVGLLSVAAPVMNQAGVVLAAINVSMNAAVAHHTDEDEIRQTIVKVVEAAKRTSTALGYAPGARRQHGLSLEGVSRTSARHG